MRISVKTQRTDTKKYGCVFKSGRFLRFYWGWPRRCALTSADVGLDALPDLRVEDHGALGLGEVPSCGDCRRRHARLDHLGTQDVEPCAQWLPPRPTRTRGVTRTPKRNTTDREEGVEVVDGVSE